MTSPSLLIFVKPPRMGLAKTRLARGVGRTQARRIATMTLARTLRAATNSDMNVRLYIAPDTALNESLGGIWPARLPRYSQGPGTLTERLSKGWNEAPPGPVLFIGADAPDLTPALLRRAICALRRHDAVFGPASDGGFWLFGMHKGPRTRPPFENVRWSGPHAMDDVWANLPDTARVGRLPMLIDLDEAEDWKAWRYAKLHKKTI